MIGHPKIAFEPYQLNRHVLPFESLFARTPCGVGGINGPQTAASQVRLEFNIGHNRMRRETFTGLLGHLHRLTREVDLQTLYPVALWLFVWFDETISVAVAVAVAVALKHLILP